MEREQKVKELLSENPFSLFSDRGDYQSATMQIFDLIENFISDLTDLQGEFLHVGAADSASRDEVAIYIAQKKLGLFRLPNQLPQPLRESRRRRKLRAAQTNVIAGNERAGNSNENSAA